MLVSGNQKLSAKAKKYLVSFNNALKVIGQNTQNYFIFHRQVQ